MLTTLAVTAVDVVAVSTTAALVDVKVIVLVVVVGVAIPVAVVTASVRVAVTLVAGVLAMLDVSSPILHPSSRVYMSQQLAPLSDAGSSTKVLQVFTFLLKTTTVQPS
jgi:hypothetical protein